MKLKYFLIILFILLNTFVYYLTEKNIDSKIEYSKYHHMHNLQLHYENFMIAQSEKADVIYYTTLDTPHFIDIISQASSTKDKVQRDILREELHLLLQERYKEFKKYGILQYHFVFTDNESFYRAHKPKKYGDNLKGIRQDFEKTNTTHQIVRGFSQGRTAHAFRNVYPIFDHNEQYIGAMEVSFPSELLQSSLNNISEIHTHFLVNKYIFETKMWSRDDRVLDYQQSTEHKDYMLSLSAVVERYHMRHTKERLDTLRDEINHRILKYRLFSLMYQADDYSYKVVSFYPIAQNVTNELSAWIVAYNDSPDIYPSYIESRYIRLISFLIFGLLLFFIFKTNQQKNELRKILNSYDDNVIFSTTDLTGKITHVSKAFCKISGHTEEELIGRPHNLIRHQDMPKEVFKDMWETIKSEKTWRGEVKNLQKDGGFYWVDAEIEPLYDRENKHIGYSAIRHDITHKKENEEIQKEIIFTMGSIGESRSEETGNHVKRVAEYSRILAQKYGLKNEEIEILTQASPMHDIGKVGIPDSILNKPGKLTDEEFKIMRTHANLGYKMLHGSDRPLLKSAAIVAYEHHEKWDGTGYPRGLKGKEIHICGRITAIADVFDALGSDRVYKKAWSDDKIFELFKDQSGKHFDPELVDIFFKHIDEFLKIREEFQDL